MTEEIIERKNDIRGSVEAFVDKYDKDNLSNRQNPVQRITDGKIFVYFLDINQPFAIYEKVLKQYVATFDGKNCELVIGMDSCDINHETNVRKILALMETYEVY